MAGVSGFKGTYVPGRNPSADVLHNWAEEQIFVWLVSEDVLDEYEEVLRRLRVRPHLIGRVVNLIRERAEEVRIRSKVEISPDPDDDPFCLCAEQGKARLPRDSQSYGLSARPVEGNCCLAGSTANVGNRTSEEVRKWPNRPVHHRRSKQL